MQGKGACPEPLLHTRGLRDGLSFEGGVGGPHGADDMSRRREQPFYETTDGRDGEENSRRAENVMFLSD